MDELIAKILAGEATNEEAQALQQWVEGSPDNRRYFEQLERLWQKAPAAQAPRVAVDTERALQKVKTQRNMRVQAGGRRNISMYWSAAAAVALLLAAWYFLQPNTPREIVADNTVRTTTLEDGSELTLNRQSTVEVKSDFSSRERRLRLKGEAFFAVAPDKERPFVVEVQNVAVTVLGTRFNVDNLADPDKIWISVEEGKVQVASGEKTEILSAGQQAVCDLNTGAINRIETPDPNASAYKTRVFSFQKTPLGEATRQVGEAYGVEFVFENPDMKQCPWVIDINNSPFEVILDNLKDTYEFNIRREGNRIVLGGGDCG